MIGEIVEEIIDNNFRNTLCKLCHKTFSSNISLKIHIGRNHKSLKLNCHVFWMASFVSGWYFKTCSTACKTKGSFSILHYLITINLL